MEENLTQKDQQLKHKMPKQKQSNGRVVIIAFVITLILIILSVVIYLIWTGKLNLSLSKTAKVCSAPQQTELMKSVGGSLDPIQAFFLKDYIPKILSLKNYQKDPNCLYPLVVWYINTSNASDAEKYLKLLLPIYPGENKFISQIQMPIYSKDQLSKTVEGLLKTNDALRNSNAVVGE